MSPSASKSCDVEIYPGTSSFTSPLFPSLMLRLSAVFPDTSFSSIFTSFILSSTSTFLTMSNDVSATLGSYPLSSSHLSVAPSLSESGSKGFVEYLVQDLERWLFLVGL